MTATRRLLAVAAAALAVAFVLPASWSATASDLVTRAASRVDERVVVAAFDERGSGASNARSIPHRGGVSLRTLAVLAERHGAAAVVFVGFDSLTLRDGPADRLVVAQSEQMQRLGVAPLLELALTGKDDEIPHAERYRIDDLAAQFAGIALPLVPEGPVLRTVPAVANVPTLEPGAVVRGGDAPPDNGSLVYGIALRGLASVALVEAPRADRVDVLGRSVPLEAGRLRIRWSEGLNDPADAAVLSATGVISSSSPPGAWDGAILLVGTTDPAHTAYYQTPIGPMPELLVHANALNTLLTGEFLRPAPAWTTLLATVLAVAVVALVWRRHPWAAGVVGIAVATGWPAASWAVAGWGWLVDPLRPTVAALVTLAGLGTATLVGQLLQRRRLAKLFAEYVPADVARDLVESGRAETAQAGERLLVTVLFCDLRGFTPTAAKLAPADVRALLDTYYETYSQIVFDHGGTVLQYTGDEIFAVFGAPVPRTDHADAALACAHAMHTTLPDLNTHLTERGLPEIAFGIGLHTGLVVAAHVGSSIRRQYSIIGDPVNVGSRLCGQAREAQTVYSQALHDHLTDPPDLTPDAKVQLKGISTPVSVYRHHYENSVPTPEPQP